MPPVIAIRPPADVQFSNVTASSKTLVIGVAGGSGSGKTTVVRRIVESIGDSQVIVLEHDRYYRDRNDLRLEERAALNYDHPDSLETDLLVQHVEALRDGRARGRAGLRLRAPRAAAVDRDRRPAPRDHRRRHPDLY